MADWQARERHRFETGYYKLLPWCSQAWWIGAIQPGGAANGHFAHVPRSDPSLLAYTPDASKGEADRQIQTKPGRYLARFFPDLGPDFIRELAGQFAAENEIPLVLFATTADEIERVYLEGPQSCMSAPVSAYASKIHPTRVYAAGDLAVAYLQPDDRVTARCIAWPAKKVFTRIYGDATRLRAGLDSLGFSLGSLWGARLLRVESEPARPGCRPRAFVVPWVDSHSTAIDSGECLLIAAGGSIDIQNTSGLSQAPDPCDGCEEYRPTVHYRGVDQNLCDACASELELCQDCDGYWDTCVTVRDSRSVCETCFGDGYFYCGECSEGASNEGAEWVSEDLRVCEACFENYSICEPCGVFTEKGKTHVCEADGEAEGMDATGPDSGGSAGNADVPKAGGF